MAAFPAPWLTIMKEQSSKDAKDYGSAKAYADAVRKWHADTYNWLNSQHQDYIAHNPPTEENVGEDSADINNNGLRRRGPLVRRVFQFVIRGNQSSTVVVEECDIASSSRRIFAELTDFVLLLLLKMVIVYVLVDLELLDLDHLERLISSTTDLDTLIKLTRGLFYAELISKLFSSLFEAFCITYGFYGTPQGCTPGKNLLGLQVVQYQEITEIPNRPNRVRVVRAPYVSLKNSLIRSIFKNMFTNFFFPINIFCYGFSHNRSVYDFAAKTLVIQRRPVL
ncbi:unnamed protein product [Bursaphelenchus xylophilus]|uniref:(pine wood nematode) hypothetical protein n=1 Tax=Bursaphelenchus xylophilus TaxID=6326 RepID=A0A1I7S0W5_BURXY|nr:unnamed protein product [Bursaphelenchus xylophilus]CAG9088142.1 unnamed protein product [Bursaphelenchus xylophilus]